MLDDAALLGEWVLQRREDAFAKLVAQYQKLVFGTALRRTGNHESARDVAQQVFALLAAKAPMLLARRNVAGWLYHVASNLAGRASRADIRRSRAHDHVATSAGCEAEGDSGLWDTVEHAISTLAALEREAIVLHFLQDYSYAEMASALAITETAARKRVSRALRTLGQRLQRRGIGRSASAIVAALAAHQSATSISSASGLVSAAITSSATVSTPFSIFAMTAMTHTLTKFTAGIAALCVIPLSLQWNANANLREEVIQARSQGEVHARSAETTESRRLSELRSELAAKQSAASGAEARVAELVELKRKLETEVVYSMGTVESMARELARASRVGNSLESVQSALYKAQKDDPESEETKRLEKKMMGLAADAAVLLPRGMSLVREMFKLERSPQKAARFYSTFLAEAANVDEETRTQVEARLEPWVAELQRSGLALPQRPKTIERVEWDQRRVQAMEALMNSLKTDFPDVHWEEFPIDQHLGSGKDSDWVDLFSPEDDRP